LDDWEQAKLKGYEHTDLQRVLSHIIQPARSNRRVLNTMQEVLTEMSLATHLGFRTGNHGTLTSRTIMLAELSTLLASVPASASKAERRSAIVSENVLGKKTTSTRRSAAQRLGELYALDPSVPLFRLLQVFWKDDPASQPLLALLCASARDPLLRITASPVLQAHQGGIVAKKDFEEAISRQAGDRFNLSTLHKIVRNAASSWTQSGHLSGRRVKKKSTPHVTAANTAYALLSARLKVFWYNICPYPTLFIPSFLIGHPRMRFLW